MAGRGTRVLTGLTVLLTFCLAGPAPAPAASPDGTARAAIAERVVDGGFEANTCPDMDREHCSNPHWDYRPATPQKQVYFCRESLCPGTPYAGLGWLQLGGNTVTSPTFITVHAAQAVSIPAAQATLSFAYRFHLLSDAPEAAGTDSLTVTIDGQPLMSGEGGPAGYTTQTIPISYLAPGPHLLKFESSCSRTPGHPCGAYEIDSVSVLSADEVACDHARHKLSVKRATLKQLRKHHAALQRIEKARHKVRKARRAVRHACPA